MKENGDYRIQEYNLLAYCFRLLPPHYHFCHLFLIVIDISM